MSLTGKKVLVITNMYPSEQNKSFGIFVKNQVDAIRQKGIQVDVAAIRDQRMGKFYVLKKYFVWVLQILQLLIKGRQYDIIHAHYVFPSGFFGMVFKRLFGIPLIVTAHGGDIEKMVKKGKFFYHQTHNIMEQADFIITVGEKLKIEIISNYIPDANKVAVINMGVNRQIFAPIEKGIAKKKLQLNEKCIHLLYVGNLIRAKGIEELVHAYNIVKRKKIPIHLHLIGADKEPAFLLMIKKKIMQDGIQDIHFYPPMKQKDVAIWMSAADALVLPSYMEGFGLVALEAMSCHTPVIGSNVGGLAHLLNGGAGVLIEPRNVNSLAKGIEVTIMDEKLQQQLIEIGEMKAAENDEEKQVEKLLKIYETAVRIK